MPIKGKRAANGRANVQSRHAAILGDVPESSSSLPAVGFLPSLTVHMTHQLASGAGPSYTPPELPGLPTLGTVRPVAKTPRAIFTAAFMADLTPLFSGLSSEEKLFIGADDVTGIMDALACAAKVPSAWAAAYKTDQRAVVKKFVDKYDEWLLARRPDGMKEKPPSGRTWTIAECSSRSQAAASHDEERAIERNKKLKKAEDFEREASERRLQVRKDGESLLLGEPVREALVGDLTKWDIHPDRYSQSHRELGRGMCALDRSMATLKPSQQSELEQCVNLRIRLEAADKAILDFNRLPDVRGAVNNESVEAPADIMFSTSSRRGGRVKGEPLSAGKDNVERREKRAWLSAGRSLCRMQTDGAMLVASSASAASVEADASEANRVQISNLREEVANRTEALCKSLERLQVVSPAERSRPLSAAFRIIPGHVGSRLPVLEIIGGALAEPVRRVIQASHCTPQEIAHDRLITSAEDKRPSQRTLYATPPMAKNGVQSQPSE